MSYELLRNPIILIYSSIFIIYLIYTYIAIAPEYRMKTHFHKTLVCGAHSGMITTFDDVVNIYKSSFHKDNEDLSYRYNLSNLLREHLADLLQTIGTQGKVEDIQIFKDYKKMISGFIKENDALSHYAELPELERNILGDISKMIELDDKELLQKKHIELASVLKTRYQEHNKKWNKLSGPLAILGVVFNLYQILI